MVKKMVSITLLPLCDTFKAIKLSREKGAARKSQVSVGGKAVHHPHRGDMKYCVLEDRV